MFKFNLKVINLCGKALIMARSDPADPRIAEARVSGQALRPHARLQAHAARSPPYEQHTRPITTTTILLNNLSKSHSLINQFSRLVTASTVRKGHLELWSKITRVTQILNNFFPRPFPPKPKLRQPRYHVRRTRW